VLASAEFIGTTKLNTTVSVETLATTIEHEALRRDKPDRVHGGGRLIDLIDVTPG
jgi:hypothetical protein